MGGRGASLGLGMLNTARICEAIFPMIEWVPIENHGLKNVLTAIKRRPDVEARRVKSRRCSAHAAAVVEC